MNATTHLPLLSLITAALYTVTACRILWYRPHRSKHRKMLSLLACLMIGSMLCRALEILACHDHPSIFEFAISAVFCLLAVVARGNIAHIFRSQPDA